MVWALSARGKKLKAVEVVLFGLAFTLVDHAVWGLFRSMGSWIPTPDIVGLSLCALGVGIVIASIVDGGWAYVALRSMKITHEAGWATIWLSAFREAQRGLGEYAVIMLKDGRRLLGAVVGVSEQQRRGHIVLQRFRWLDHERPEEDAEQPGMILLNAEDVSAVTFLSSDEEQTNDKEGPPEETDTPKPAS